MPPVEYDTEKRQQAADLYILGGLNFEEVSQVTGVSVTQLKRWSAQEREWAEERGEKVPKDWPDQRREVRIAMSSAPREKILLRALLINKAINTQGDFKAVLAAAMWEKTQQPKKETQPGASVPARTGTPATEPIGAEAVIIKTPQDAVMALQGLVNQKINWVANNPGQLTSQDIKDLNNILALMEDLSAKYRPDEAAAGPAPGLSDEAAEAIRRQVLGMS